MLNTRPTRRSWVLVVIALLAASGCGQSGGGGSGGGGSNAGQFCPLDFSPGESCDTPGDSCVLEADECGGGTSLTCNQDHVWVEMSDAKCCNGGEDSLPYPDCPASLPMAADACVVCIGALPCTYTVDVGCGDQEASAECDEDTSTWTVQMPQCGG